MSDDEGALSDLTPHPRTSSERALIEIAFQKLRHELTTSMLGLGHRIERAESAGHDMRAEIRANSERLKNLELEAARAEATGRLQGAIAGAVVSLLIGGVLVVLRFLLGAGS